MGSWCADNLRNVSAWRELGLAVTTTSDEGAKLYDAGLRQLVSWMDCEQLGGLEKTLENLKKVDPDGVIGRCLILGLDALGTTRSIHSDPNFDVELNQLIKDAKAHGNRREQLHAQAVNQFARGNFSKSCSLWEQILAETPTDLLALKFSHDAYFFKGENPQKLASVERVLPKWRSDMPCYSYLFGMEAFAAEEMGFYERAKRAGRKGLELNRHDAWSTHALAHCHEMLGEYEEGRQFMEATVKDWEPCWILACHNFWHNALFYVEVGDYETALTIYDTEVERRCHSGAMLDIVDGASMLQRLQMEGVDVGQKRWNELADIVDSKVDGHVLAFNDAHLSMVASNLESDQMEVNQKQSLANLNRGAQTEQELIIKSIGTPLCEAITLYNHDNFTASFDILYPMRRDIIKIGGSHAQRDVFTQLIIHAGLNSTCPQHREQTLKVIEERRKIKPVSPLLDRVVAKFL